MSGCFVSCLVDVSQELSGFDDVLEDGVKRGDHIGVLELVRKYGGRSEAKVTV